MSLTRDEILGKPDLKQVRVKVPEWGGEVIVQEMTAATRLEFEASVADGDERRLRAMLIVYTVVDESGERIFTPDDVEALTGKNFKAVRRVSNVGFRLSKVGKLDLEAASENFPEAQPGG